MGHIPISLSPLSFTPGTPNFPVTPSISTSPTLAFRSPSNTTLSSAPKPLKHKLNSSQKPSLSSSLLSLPGPYAETNTHLSHPKVILTHINLEFRNVDEISI